MTDGADKVTKLAQTHWPLKLALCYSSKCSLEGLERASPNSLLDRITECARSVVFPHLAHAQGIVSEEADTKGHSTGRQRDVVTDEQVEEVETDLQIAPTPARESR